MAVKTRTLQVICPHCMSSDDTVTLDLNDLSECRCAGCDEVFSAQEACDRFVAMAERWEAVANWIRSAPVA